MATTGCTSTTMSDSLAQIDKEGNQQNGRIANKKVLMNIQALRLSQKVAKHTYTFSYDLNDKELSYSNKIKIAQLLTQQQHAIINIAPARGTDSLEQLNLSVERAKALRHYTARFTQKVTIVFSPKLPIDTINLVIGA
jgi:hypothetical protein